jgi:hypothetical protein
MKTEIYTIEQTENSRILKRNGEIIAKAYVPKNDMFMTTYFYPTNSNLSPYELWQKLVYVSIDCWQKVKRDKYLSKEHKELLRLQAINDAAIFYRFCFGYDIYYEYLLELIN